MAADRIAAAVVSAAGISERRMAVLMDANQSKGLPSFLVLNPGLNSGFMIAQYTAASIVSEMKGNAWPSTVDSIPTAENSEDYNAMAATSARRAARNVDLLWRVTAVELLCAYQGVQFRKPGRLGVRTAALEQRVSDELGELFLTVQNIGGELEFQLLCSEWASLESASDSLRPFIIRDGVLYPLLEQANEFLRSGEALRDR
jgi:histidine ammonia-lyase